MTKNMLTIGLNLINFYKKENEKTTYNLGNDLINFSTSTRLNAR